MYVLVGKPGLQKQKFLISDWLLFILIDFLMFFLHGSNWLQHSAAIRTFKRQLDRSLALRCKVAMTTIEVLPSLEELSLVDVRGQQCMPGVETNLGELLLTAAETTPDNVCLEVESRKLHFCPGETANTCCLYFQT